MCVYVHGEREGPSSGVIRALSYTPDTFITTNIIYHTAGYRNCTVSATVHFNRVYKKKKIS